MREAERKLLQSHYEWVSSQRRYYANLAAQCKAALKEAMHAHVEEFKEAEAAITTVAGRVRADTLSVERKKYALATERYESEKLGVDTRRHPKKGKPQTRDPQPGPSSQTGRVYKQARRPQGNKGPSTKGTKSQQKAISTLLNALLKK